MDVALLTHAEIIHDIGLFGINNVPGGSYTWYIFFLNGL
jgi:hypothetical protein